MRADSTEKGALRRVSVRLVPLYFVNYLDRTNLGIAKATVSADQVGDDAGYPRSQPTG
ncbi:hypothetical protein [Mycolicibacterium sp.]|uniref:hypothetical protein n=1 Tax=Mycolicibacterium sp. TaxID=2320850 RepID=UPI001A289196|nr:hypothetical protein [Mycolicibacterium sp.]MBJ7401400.1 hypothetical protein [Mycolicibacterium sp.]